MMSSRKLGSPSPKLRKTEHMEDSESYAALQLTKTVEGDCTRAERNESDDAKKETQPKSLTEDGDGGQRSEQQSQLSPVQMLVTDVVTPVDCLRMPEEIWKDVFDRLDSVDKLSCLRADPNWRNWLGNKRTLLFFPEVASLAFPPNDPKLLECRKMCKSWKEEIDSQALKSLVLLSFEKGGVKDDSKTIAFETVEKIRQFLEEMESHPGNPFPWRSIKIGWNTYAQSRFAEAGPDALNAYLLEFQTKLIQLLDELGHHIYHVQFELHYYEWRLGSPDLLREVLLRVPNLRKLEIKIENYYPVSTAATTAYYAVNPLPHLVHLETLKLEDTMEHDGIPILCSYIAPQSTSIKRMQVPRFYEEMHDFPNLEVFKGGWIELRDLVLFRNAAQPLPFKKLVLEVDNGLEKSSVDFQQLFACLAVFAESLEYLRVSAWDPLILRDKDFRINLPKLKYLRIGNFDGSLDTLTELSSLSDLDVSFAPSQTWDEVTVTLPWIQKQISDSNIWEVIPSLQNFILRIDEEDGGWKYTRDSSTGLIVEVRGHKFKFYRGASDEEDEGTESSDDGVEENQSENENDSREDIDDEEWESYDSGDDDTSENEGEEDGQNREFESEDEEDAESVEN